METKMSDTTVHIARLEAEIEQLHLRLEALAGRWQRYARHSGQASVDAVMDGTVLKDRMAGENRAWHTAVLELRQALKGSEE